MEPRTQRTHIMRNGIVEAICISPAARAPMQMVQEVEAIAGQGLKGDRYATGQGSFNRKTGVGNRQVTLIHARFFPGSGFEYTESRRNIVVGGIELMRLIGHEFQIGNAHMRGVKYCEPCLTPSRLAGIDARFMDVFEDTGGLIVEVIESGLIRLNDVIVPPPKNYKSDD